MSFFLQIPNSIPFSDLAIIYLFNVFITFRIKHALNKPLYLRSRKCSDGDVSNFLSIVYIMYNDDEVNNIEK